MVEGERVTKVYIIAASGPLSLESYVLFALEFSFLDPRGSWSFSTVHISSKIPEDSSTIFVWVYLYGWEAVITCLISEGYKGLYYCSLRSPILGVLCPVRPGSLVEAHLLS
jgi:hypothetical protein